MRSMEALSGLIPAALLIASGLIEVCLPNCSARQRLHLRLRLRVPLRSSRMLLRYAHLAYAPYSAATATVLQYAAEIVPARAAALLQLPRP